MNGRLGVRANATFFQLSDPGSIPGPGFRNESLYWKFLASASVQPNRDHSFANFKVSYKLNPHTGGCKYFFPVQFSFVSFSFVSFRFVPFRLVR